MATPYTQNGGALADVRLTEIPVSIRRRVGRRLYEAAVQDRNLMLAVEIENAIERPSDRVYWLPASKVREVRERQRW